MNILILKPYSPSKILKKKISICFQLPLVELSGLEMQDNLTSAAALCVKVYKRRQQDAFLKDFNGCSPFLHIAQNQPKSQTTAP